MNMKSKDFFLYGIFALMFFWDLLDLLLPNVQFVILICLFFIFAFTGNKIYLDQTVLMVAAVVLLHGVVNIVLGNDTIKLFSIQFGAILVCYICYSSLTYKYSIQNIFRVYWKSAYIMSVIGLIEAILGIMNNTVFTKLPVVFTFTKYWYRVVGLVKLSSLCREPSFLGYYLAPAVCLILFRVFASELTDETFDCFKKKWQMVCICLVYVMTFSGAGYIGICIMGIVIGYKKGISIKKVMIPIIAFIIAVGVYEFVPDIHVRVDDTLSIFVKGVSKSEINISSYTYYNNFNVAKSGFLKTMGLGSGLGSYQLIYDEFTLGTWSASSSALNREDANSALFRIATEFGMLGIIGIIVFLYKYFIKGKNSYMMYSCAIFSLFCMFLLRQGNYTHGGSVLFLWLYVKCFKDAMTIGNEKLAEGKECSVK